MCVFQFLLLSLFLSLSLSGKDPGCADDFLLDDTHSHLSDVLPLRTEDAKTIRAAKGRLASDSICICHAFSLE